MRRNVARSALLAASVMAVSPPPAWADCQDLSAFPGIVPVGMMRAGRAADRSLRVWAIGYNGPRGNICFNNPLCELNVGPNHTIGFLPAGQSYTIQFAVATANTQTAGDIGKTCTIYTLRAQIKWFPQLNCAQSWDGTDFQDHVINTCFPSRSQTTLNFPGIGFAPSVETDMTIYDSHGTPKDSGFGCFNVSQSPGGCND
jgi:hypothetical protein